MFDRCYSGMIKNQHFGNKVRFLTLTTSSVSVDGLDSDERLELIQRNFRSLKDRYEKEFGCSLGDYFSVRTLEGNGVIHILFNGKYIPHKWLILNWYELHGSYVVDIREPRGDPYKGSMYVISQYVANQKGRKIFGYSRDWVYRGFVKDLVECRDCCKDWSRMDVNSYGVCWAPVDYGKYKRMWRLFLVRRLDGLIFSPWMLEKLDIS